MIELSELRTETNYWFNACNYAVFGKYIVRQRYYLKLTDALIYLDGTEGKIFSNENLTLDARELKDIRVSDKDLTEDHSEYYKNFDYND